MNRNGSLTGKEPTVSRGFASLAHDVIELSELQARLLMMDLHTSSQRIRTIVAVGLVGLAMLLGSIPLALFTLAEVLVEQAGWSRGLALGIATLVGFALAGGLFAFVWAKLESALSTFDRSREELQQNFTWLKTTLRRGPKSPNPWPSTRASS